ncbi:MAG: dynamin family protein, partial [Candidatus Korobacteraceae bacterium]
NISAPNPGTQTTPGDAQALSRLAEIASGLGECSTAEEIRQLVSRINEGRFFVACVGQFKRGKSTLLDALVGEELLPTGVVPVTTVPTVLRYGAQRTARVLIDGKWTTIRPEDLGQYVSEELNPENKKLVEGVEAFLPSPLLDSGMCLVDTPGIGSVFSGNTEATKDFIPQIDAAILVVGADPPISGEELALIEAVGAHVDHIVVVLNKMDRVSLDERQQAGAFATKMLASRLKKPVERIYEVSALSKLKNSGNDDDWDVLTEDLRRLASKSGQDMTRSAAERGARRFSASLRRSVDERIRALQEPIENSEQRIASLRQTVSQAEQSLRDLGALFSAEQMRLSNILLARRKEFLQEVFPTAFQELHQEILPVKTTFGPASRRELMLVAQAVARRHVMPWLDSEEAHAEELYTSVTQRFVNLVNGLLQRISEEQSADFAHLPKSLDAEQGFRTRSRFYFYDMTTIAQPASPLLYCTDVVMGALHIRRWFRKDAERFLENLLDTNASRVQGDAEQRVVESRLRLESDVRKLLREVSATAEQALTNAREVMAAGANAVATELERLRSLHQELNAFAGTA